jgi:YacP-like NYN domain-containing protein
VTRREVVVDGHNAAHRLRLAGGSASVREQVVRRARAAAVRGTAVTVFFDGHPAAGEFGGTEHGGVTLRFSGDAEADDAIVDHLRRVQRPDNVTIVTDDRGLARRAEQIGAKTSGIDRFFGAPSKSPGRREHAEDKSAPAGLTAADFGLPDEVDLEAPGPVLDGVKDVPGPGGSRKSRRRPRDPHF